MAARRSFAEQKINGSLSEINVTPLVDVMLVLLIIFMVTAPMMKSGMKVNLPVAKAQEIKKIDDVVVSITPDRYVYVNKVNTNINLLQDSLKNLFAGRDQKVVYLEADSSVPYGYVVQVLDTIKGAGIEKVGVIVAPKKTKKP